MEPFVLRALLAGLGIALVTAFLGPIVVWRRMAYFGEALAHASLLGVPIALLLRWNPTGVVFLVAQGVALSSVLLQRTARRLPLDTIFGILAHGTLGLALVVLAFVQGVRVDLIGYLFGDILAVSWSDLIGLGIGLLAVVLIVGRLWNAILLIAVDPELAAVEGVPVGRVQVATTLLLGFVVAFGMKVVGAVMITALLIIPPAAARRLARTPEGMVVWTFLIAVAAVAGGLAASFRWDTPSGPSIVVCSAALFLLSRLVPPRRFRLSVPDIS